MVRQSSFLSFLKGYHAQNYFHERKCFSSRKEIFFFMNRNISFHENNSVKADYRLK